MVGPGGEDKGKTTLVIPGFQMKGDTIAGRYRIEKLLGTGTAGVVLAAHHVYLRRAVTLKLLTGAGQTGQAALAGAHRAASLAGPHVARILDTGFAEDGTPYVATESFAGRTLAEELAARKQIPIVEAVRLVLEACTGLASAHAAGIAHGAIKPQNLFVADVDGGRVLKVLDFGMRAPIGETSPWFTSPAYLAPEQIRDPSAIDARTDLWALGILLHELVAGSVPFTADSVAGMLVAVSCDEPAMLAAQETPFALARIVKACLARDPAGRPADVADLARQLAPFAGADGRELAAAVATALTAAPAAAPPPEPAADEDAVAPRPVTLSGRPTQPSARMVALHRRRIGAIAAVGAAALLAIVGLSRSPTHGVQLHITEDLSSPRQFHAVAVPAPLPVPAQTAAAPVNEAPTPPPAPSPSPPPAAPPPASAAPPKPRVEPPGAPRRLVQVHDLPAARTLPKEPAGSRPRGAQIVRENPYAHGAAPARAPERRK